MDFPSDGGGGSAQGISRQDIQAAIVKAAELRALHATLLQGGNGKSPALARLDAGASPSVSRGTSHFMVPEEYPVFTPISKIGEDESLPGYQYLRPEHRSLSQTWSAIGLEGEGRENEAFHFDNKCMNKLSTSTSAPHVPSAIGHSSNRTSRANRMPLLQAAAELGILKPSSQTDSGEYGAVTVATSYDTSKQETVNVEMGADRKSLKNVKIAVASCNLEQSVKTHPKNKGPVLSWLFPKARKKTKPEMSPKVAESEDMSQLLKEWGVLSLESLKKELMEANENRDAALFEVSEMRLSLVELQQKLVSLESYCEELKKALKQAMHAKSSQGSDRSNLSKRMKSIGGRKESLLPVSEEVMVEGFLQLVSEARLSVKQFCKTLIKQIEEINDGDVLSEKIDMLLQPYELTANSKHSKAVIYHLEAIVNQSLYQDFENSAFQSNGTPKFLDPRQESQGNFSSFVSLRNLSWNEVLQKGTKFYSEDFCKFCDQKMSSIVSLLNWSRPWPEQLLHCFFIAAKCIWLLHLLAFSFSPPLTILRVAENREFNHAYMEDVLLDRHKAQAPAPVKIMVMPGFYVQDRVLKCRVLCRFLWHLNGAFWGDQTQVWTPHLEQLRMWNLPKDAWKKENLIAKGMDKSL